MARLDAMKRFFVFFFVLSPFLKIFRASKCTKFHAFIKK